MMSTEERKERIVSITLSGSEARWQRRRRVLVGVTLRGSLRWRRRRTGEKEEVARIFQMLEWEAGGPREEVSREEVLQEVVGEREGAREW